MWRLTRFYGKQENKTEGIFFSGPTYEKYNKSKTSVPVVLPIKRGIESFQSTILYNDTSHGIRGKKR